MGGVGLGRQSHGDDAGVQESARFQRGPLLSAKGLDRVCISNGSKIWCICEFSFAEQAVVPSTVAFWAIRRQRPVYEGICWCVLGFLQGLINT